MLNRVGARTQPCFKPLTMDQSANNTESFMLERQNHAWRSSQQRPERRSALIAHELFRLNVDIAAFSEVRFPREGRLQEYGVGQGKLQQRGAFQALFSWSAPPSSPGWKICQLLIPTAWCPWTFLWKISDMSRFSMSTVHLFELNLQKKISSTWCFATVSIDPCRRRGDNPWWFQCLSGPKWRVLGWNGVDNCNDNGCLLLELCTEQQLVIPSTIFHHLLFLFALLTRSTQLSNSLSFSQRLFTNCCRE